MEKTQKQQKDSKKPLPPRPEGEGVIGTQI